MLVSLLCSYIIILLLLICNPEKNIKLATLIGKTSELGVYGNNEIDIFTEGEKLLARMLEDISKAKDHIHAEYFIIETDETGNTFKEALIKKAQEEKITYNC